MILAGDVGGTKVNLAFFKQPLLEYEGINLATFSSQKYENLNLIIRDYLNNTKENFKIEAACFAVAGPIEEKKCYATNLPWIIDTKALVNELNIPNVYLINDLEANAYSIQILPTDSILQIHSKVIHPEGNRCIVSPGTGLGEAGLYWDGKSYYPFASEGGHCDFAPCNQLQMDFLSYLYDHFNHISYERILSGPGLLNIYHFFRDKICLNEPLWLSEKIQKGDPAEIITIHALEKKSILCEKTLDLFVSILGAECSNSVLKYMAIGGVYLGGGIPPKILPKLKERIFYEAFLNKGRFRQLLKEVPVQIILDDKASLKGAAYYCLLHSKKN
ncbi:MAG: glucokinase [Chlamydiales bacterium]